MITSFITVVKMRLKSQRNAALVVKLMECMMTSKNGEQSVSRGRAARLLEWLGSCKLRWLGVKFFASQPPREASLVIRQSITIVKWVYSWHILASCKQIQHKGLL